MTENYVNMTHFYTNWTLDSHNHDQSVVYAPRTPLFIYCPDPKYLAAAFNIESTKGWHRLGKFQLCAATANQFIINFHTFKTLWKTTWTAKIARHHRQGPRVTNDVSRIEKTLLEANYQEKSSAVPGRTDTAIYGRDAIKKKKTR